MNMMWMVLVVMTMLNLITMGSVLGPLLGYEHWCCWWMVMVMVVATMPMARTP